MKKSGASQQQYEAISEVKVASNGIDETELLDNMPPSSVSPGLASKQTGKQASCTQVLANESKQEASPTVFQASTAEATLNATKVVPIQVKKGGSTVSVSKAKPGGTQPLGDLTCQVPFPSRGNVKQVGNVFQRGEVQHLKASPQAVALDDAGHEKEKDNIPPAVSYAKHEAKSILEVVQASSKENLFHFSDVEDRFQKFMPLSGKTTNALEINVLDVSELLASPMVIEYGGYFVILRELTKSMKKEGFVLSHVMEVGLESIMLNLPPDSKKVVMPLKFSVWLQKMELTSKELIFRFKKLNHLDHQDMEKQGSNRESGEMLQTKDMMDPTCWMRKSSLEPRTQQIVDAQWGKIWDGATAPLVCLMEKKMRRERLRGELRALDGKVA
ncbi:hypothetical protein ZWY2020_022763 [Hordeum vulgare]|nr:hypothetical protein ZWY2020_022763 [Hordeum vulgare]